MKDEIRKHMRKKREQLSESERKQASKQVARWLETLLKEDMLIASYRAFRAELEILPSAKGTWCYPRVLDETHMEMIVPDDFRRGRYGIEEPIGKSVDPKQIDIILVPLLAYDEKGYRIGYGKGYYDRYLKKCSALKIGVAYCFQKVADTWPHDLDVKLGLILTPAGITRV